MHFRKSCLSGLTKTTTVLLMTTTRGRESDTENLEYGARVLSSTPVIRFKYRGPKLRNLFYSKDSSI
jgi:BRCT domain type II-containing protein